MSLSNTDRFCFQKPGSARSSLFGKTVYWNTLIVAVTDRSHRFSLSENLCQLLNLSPVTSSRCSPTSGTSLTVKGDVFSTDRESLSWHQDSQVSTDRHWGSDHYAVRKVVYKKENFMEVSTKKLDWVVACRRVNSHADVLVEFVPGCTQRSRTP